MAHSLVRVVQVVNDSLRVALTGPITLAKSMIEIQAEPHRWWSSPLLQTLLGAGAAIAGGLGAPLVQGWLDQRRRRAELLARVRAALEQVAATARSTAKKEYTRPISPETMNGILVEWQRYDRISDCIGLLGVRVVEEEIDAILSFSRMIAEKVLEDERRFRQTVREVGHMTPLGISVEPEITTAIHDKRKLLLGLVVTMGNRAQSTLDKVNRRWTPEAGHEQRGVPEGAD